MGCAGSKIDDLPAVTLCRDRLTFLDEALHHRFDLAEAHFAYVQSLNSVATSFHHFFHSAGIDASNVPASPILNLPAQRKGDHIMVEDSGGGRAGAAGDSGHLSSGSGSAGSHLHFHTDSEDDDADSGSDVLHHHLHSGDEHLHHLHSDSPPASRMIPRHMDEDTYGSSDGFFNIPGGPGNPYPGGPGNPYPGSPGNPYPGGHGNPYPGSPGNPYPGGPGNPYPGSPGIPYPASAGGAMSGGYVHMNYMKKQPTQSLLYRQKPGYPPEVMQKMGDSGYPSYYPSNQNPNSYYYGNNNSAPYNYMGYGGPGGGGGGMGFFGGGPPGPNGSPPRQGGMGEPSSSKPAPPPPPPSSSTWDFLNPFESIEANYPPYTPSIDSREVREEEGIPDLEYDEYQHEVVKEVHGHQKFVDSGASSSGSSVHGGKNYSKAEEEEPEIGESKNDAEALYRSKPSASREAADSVGYEVHMDASRKVDKTVVGEERRSEDKGNVGAFKGRAGGSRTVSEVVKEIQVQFERASASGNELMKILEVGRLPYLRKNGAFQVSTKMLNAITPSLPSTSRDSEASTSGLDLEQEVGLRSRTLSATLHKLYLWEKKLLEEVKAEEKMRVTHDRKLLRLRSLDERGAEPHKIDVAQSVVKSLSTKIKIAIQLVDRISVTINKLRDDELWPQLNELIKGLARMWKGMLECHHSQFQAVDGARGLDAIAFPKNPSDSHVEATRQLAYDLISWTKRFANWIDAQKGYVRALNNWLRKCLPDEEPIVTDDGPAPFSPGRMGAPPVFVICYQWSQSMETLSEKEVLASMQVFAMMVYQFWEQDKAEMQQKVMPGKDMERKARNLDKEDVRIQKEIQALDKKMALVSGEAAGGHLLAGNIVFQGDTSKKGSLSTSLQHMFEAMDRFTAESVKIYEDLLQRTEDISTGS